MFQKLFQFNFFLRLKSHRTEEQLQSIAGIRDSRKSAVLSQRKQHADHCMQPAMHKPTHCSDRSP